MNDPATKISPWSEEAQGNNVRITGVCVERERDLTNPSCSAILVEVTCELGRDSSSRIITWRKIRNPDESQTENMASVESFHLSLALWGTLAETPLNMEQKQTVPAKPSPNPWHKKLWTWWNSGCFMPQSFGVVCYTAIDSWDRHDGKKKMSETSTRATLFRPCFNPKVFEFYSESNEEWLKDELKYDWVW